MFENKIKKKIGNKIEDLLAEALASQSRMVSFCVEGRNYSYSIDDCTIKCSNGFDVVPFDEDVFHDDFMKMSALFGAFLP